MFQTHCSSSEWKETREERVGMGEGALWCGMGMLIKTENKNDAIRSDNVCAGASKNA